MTAQLAPVMTESGSPSKLSAWYDYLTTPTVGSPTDLPAPDQYVMIAMLDDGGSARLGTARYYPMSQTYRLSEGNLEVPVSARGPGDVYVTDSGRYRILTPTQHLELKKHEAMAAAAAAQVAIAPKPLAPMPTEHMAALSILPPNPAAIGCSMHAEVSTVIAVGPANVEAAAARAKPLADAARKNHNMVTLVVLGVASEADALAALALPTPRIFLAGANEMVALGTRERSGPIRKYLAEAVLMAYVKPTGKTELARPDEVVWLLPASPVPLGADSRSFLIHQKRRTLTLWCDALNEQWRKWYAAYDGTSSELNDEEEGLRLAYTSFPVMQRHPPLAQLTTHSMGLIGTIEGAPMGIVDHTIQWKPTKSGSDLWPMPASCWATTGTPTRNGSVYWAVITWCHNTRQVLRTPRPLLDHQLPFDELKYDMRQTLVSLLMHTLPGGMRPYMSNMAKMKGTLGPIITAGRANNEPMRVTHWTTEDAPAVTMLLPEGYVQEVLRDYNAVHSSSALLAAQGFLVLPRADEIAINFDGLSPVELESERTLFGPRLWIHGVPNGMPTRELPMPPARSMIVYRTQLDADTVLKPNDLRLPGTRVASDAAAHVYYVATTSDDLLCGMRVRWTRAGEQPFLDADTIDGGSQVAYETVL